jgi:alpha-ribazole phosphatase
MNAAFRFDGSTDADMSPAGVRQIERVRDRLSGRRIDAACSSDLRRAVTSAQIITAGRNIEYNQFPELREMDYGDIEGMTFGEIHHTFPDVARSIESRDCSVSFPRGECFTDFEKRLRAFASVLEKYAPEQTVLIVAHGGALRMLLCVLLEAGLEFWWKINIDNASLSIVDTYPGGNLLTLLNDVSHLEVK